MAPFQGAEYLLIHHQGRRASRLPLAILFRSFGAPICISQLTA
jgi:hypothetical protein